MTRRPTAVALAAFGLAAVALAAAPTASADHGDCPAHALFEFNDTCFYSCAYEVVIANHGVFVCAYDNVDCLHDPWNSTYHQMVDLVQQFYPSFQQVPCEESAASCNDVPRSRSDIPYIEFRVCELPRFG